MADDLPRSRSPRAPSIALDDAIQRALKIYEKERRHATPTEVVAQDMGYKTANSGAALGALASLRYFGLLERLSDGRYSVSKDFEEYQFSPSDDHRRGLMLGWLRRPPIFADLLEQYIGGLPSDASLKFDLIKRGFSPDSAASTLSVFKRSVEFARVYEQPTPSDQRMPEADEEERDDRAIASEAQALSREAFQAAPPSDPNSDRIPVRLPGGRRAWLEIPTPFYQADKERLKAQIDLLLTEDDDVE